MYNVCDNQSGVLFEWSWSWICFRDTI